MDSLSTYQFTVSADSAGVRLDQFLVQQFQKKYSRSYLQYLIDQGHVFVNQKKVKRHETVRAGERIEVRLQAKQTHQPWLEPEAIPLDILYEDDQLLLVNKPSGMVVHPACGHYSGTLVHALLAYCKTLSKEGGAERPGIVHRLDKDTSGLILVAKTDQAHQHLARQFASRQVKKKYLAIVKGKVARVEGVIRFALARHPIHRQIMTGFSEPGRGKEAETRYRVVQQLKGATYLELEPLTGRTHQIRVHLAKVGHSILGDLIYGRGMPRLKVPRLMLHASWLSFAHPTHQQMVTFQAPLPSDFGEVLKQLSCF